MKAKNDKNNPGKGPKEKDRLCDGWLEVTDASTELRVTFPFYDVLRVVELPAPTATTPEGVVISGVTTALIILESTLETEEAEAPISTVESYDDVMERLREASKES